MGYIETKQEKLDTTITSYPIVLPLSLTCKKPVICNCRAMLHFVSFYNDENGKCWVRTENIGYHIHKRYQLIDIPETRLIATILKLGVLYRDIT